MGACKMGSQQLNLLPPFVAKQKILFKQLNRRIFVHLNPNTYEAWEEQIFESRVLKIFKAIQILCGRTRKKIKKSNRRCTKCL